MAEVPGSDALDLEGLARLARLRLTEEEAEAFRRQLPAILEAMRRLQELDLDHVEPLAHPLDLACPLREDRVETGAEPGDVLREAPRHADGFFLVPAVLPARDAEPGGAGSSRTDLEATESNEIDSSGGDSDRGESDGADREGTP
ncbi:MAG: Asp-tRNA(Asn)/Glu-tRNA(Gln) amidotransferase subunit GatC [Candidatus Eisenbacteria bacterium]|nr:Asp-tRNA(Asn)/Glu-tRNA(Gln) amidotransferase subunit GatC [Candidatus Eisenbacteria bacterium]